MPRPLEFALRLVAAMLLVGSAVYLFRIVIVSAAIPPIQAVLQWLDPEFRVLSLQVSTDQSPETLRLHVNLAQPLQVPGGILQPFGTEPGSIGGFQIDLTLGGIFSHASLLVILAVAWPTRSVRAALVRLSLALLLAAAMVIVVAASTFHAELWHAILGGGQPLRSIEWSRFLMDGGGFAIALTFAAVLIVCSRRHVTVQSRACHTR